MGWGKEERLTGVIGISQDINLDKKDSSILSCLGVGVSQYMDPMVFVIFLGIDEFSNYSVYMISKLGS